MKKLDNKGYMLVEIILAVALAMGVGYFLIELTLKVKNTNDDLLVESLVKTDQGIIYNMIMKDVYNDTSLTIDDVYQKIEIDSDNNKVTYGTEIIFVSDYAQVGNKKKEGNKIIIPIIVKQLPEDNFNVEIYLSLD